MNPNNDNQHTPKPRGVRQALNELCDAFKRLGYTANLFRAARAQRSQQLKDKAAAAECDNCADLMNLGGWCSKCSHLIWGLANETTPSAP